MVTIRKSEGPVRVAGDQVYAMLGELLTTHDVQIHGNERGADDVLLVVDDRRGTVYEYAGRLDNCIRRAWAGEPPEHKRNR